MPSLTLKLKVLERFVSAAGINCKRPALMWLALIMSPAVTEAQSLLPVVSYWSVPLSADGKLVITTLWSVSPSTSAKRKSLTLRGRGVSSRAVREIASAVGPSFTAVTVMLSVLVKPVFVV